MFAACDVTWRPAASSSSLDGHLGRQTSCSETKRKKEPEQIDCPLNGPSRDSQACPKPHLQDYQQDKKMNGRHKRSRLCTRSPALKSSSRANCALVYCVLLLRPVIFCLVVSWLL